MSDTILPKNDKTKRRMNPGRPDRFNKRLKDLNQHIHKLNEEGLYAQAVEAAIKARELISRHLEETDPEYTGNLISLARLYYKLQDYTTAEPLFKEVLAIRRATLGVNSPEVAMTMENLGSLYRAVGNYTAAENLFRQALAIQEIVLDKDDHDIAITLNSLAGLYSERGDYVEAEKQYRQVLELDRKMFGEAHPEYATTLNNLGLLYERLGRYDEAEISLRGAVDIRCDTVGAQHPDYATSLNNLGLLYLATGNYATAESMLQEALNIRRQVFGALNSSVATSLNGLAELYLMKGRYAEAESLLEEAMEIRRVLLGEHHPAFARIVHNLASVYQKMGNYRLAEQFEQQALELYRQAVGENHPEYAATLGSLGDLLMSWGKYREAEPLLRRALDLQRDVLGTQHIDYAVGLSRLAELLRRTLDYEAAETLFNQMLDTLERVVSRDHPEYATGVAHLAALFIDSGRYDDAQLRLEEVVDIRQRTLGEAHPDYARALSNLAHVYFTTGFYRTAEELYNRSLEIQRQALGEDSPAYASTLANLATLYRETGSFARAERLTRQALDITRKAYSERHPTYASLVSKLGHLHLILGNYAAAEPLFSKAKEIRRELFGETHLEFANSLNDLAVLYGRIGKHRTAWSLFQQVLDIDRQVYGEIHPARATTVHNMAALCARSGNYDAAELRYRKALEIRGKLFGSENPTYAASLHGLGELCRKMGNYVTAEPLLRESLKVRQTTLGPEHRYVAQSLNSLATLLIATDRPVEAMPLLQEALAIEDRTLELILTFGSESQRMAYLRILRVSLYRFLSFVLRYYQDSPSAAQASFDLVLRRKALGAEILAQQRDHVLQGHYPELAPDLLRLMALRQRIARQTLVGSRHGNRELFEQGLDELITHKEQLESELARRIPQISMKQQLEVVNQELLGHTLPTDSALIEFVYIRDYNFQASSDDPRSRQKSGRYVAFVLKAGQSTTPRMIDLGDAKPIDELIARFRTTITQSQSQLHTRGIDPGLDLSRHRSVRDHARSTGRTDTDVLFSEGVRLRQLLFDPLLPALLGCRRVFLALDGELMRLPFEVLPIDQNSHVIDNYFISYLNTSRDILRFGSSGIHEPGAALILADPDFDLHEAPVSQESQESIEQRGDRWRDIDRSKLRFRRLPGTYLEGQQLAAMLRVQALVGDKALESAVKSCHSPYILHIATHGFFLSNQADGFDEEQFEMAMAEGATNLDLLHGLHALENPLLRSGLALAGANTWLRGESLPADAEDGLLTAEDVTGLDLLNTEIAVLSACDTGLGEVQVGEGVFGLQRAFILAGAKTLVMSLWRVQDEATRKLMLDFYERVLVGQHRAEALRDAKMALKANYPNPLHWGAFVCMGDPGPLPSRGSVQ